MIVDTNALSAWRDGDSPLLRAMSSGTLAIPVIVLGEYRYGIARSRQRVASEAWLGEVLTAVDVLVINTDTATRYASTRADLHQRGTPIPANDLWIAALALQHQLPVLSRDKHFDVVDGLQRISW